MSESTNVKISETEMRPRAEVLPAVSVSVRLLNLVVVILPFVGFVAIIVSLWGRGLNWIDGGLLVTVKNSILWNNGGDDIKVDATSKAA